MEHTSNAKGGILTHGQPRFSISPVLSHGIDTTREAKRATIDMTISLRQLQEKCREQGKPPYIAFIDLINVFDLVSRDGLFKILAKIGCPPTLLSIVKSFHDDMKGTVLYDGTTSDPFNSLSGVKQVCPCPCTV